MAILVNSGHLAESTTTVSVSTLMMQVLTEEGRRAPDVIIYSPGLLFYSKDVHTRTLCFDEATYLNGTHPWNCFVSREYGKYQLY